MNAQKSSGLDGFRKGENRDVYEIPRHDGRTSERARITLSLLNERVAHDIIQVVGPCLKIRKYLTTSIKCSRNANATHFLKQYPADTILVPTSAALPNLRKGL